MSLCQFNQNSLATLSPAALGVETIEKLELASCAIAASELLTKEPSEQEPAPSPNAEQPMGEGLDSWGVPAQVGQPLARVLQARYRTYREQLKQCQKKCSTESVHELRVATRRLIAQLVLLECVAPRETIGKTSRLLKRRLKALSELRDTHVQRIFVEERIAKFPELILVRDFLKRRERRLVKAVDRKTKSFRNRKLGQWIGTVCASLLLHPEDQAGQRDLAATVLQATSQAYQRALARRSAIDPADLGTVHMTRIAFKKFRYMVESLTPVLVALTPRQLRRLAHYQRRMGHIQDLVVMEACIESFISHHRGTQALLGEFSAYLEQRRTRALRQFVQSADELLDFWPPVATMPRICPGPAHRG
jgi:CHAD domain-containing protein